MSKSILGLVVPVLAALPLLPGLVQERTKPKDAASVPQLLDKAKEAFGAARYGACLAALNEAVGLVGIERAKVIRAALPAAPAGMEIVPDTSGGAANPFAAALMGSVGNVVQQEYSGDDKSLDVTVTADSPLVQMFAMWITNPSLLEEGAEVVKYGSYSAVLKPNGEGSWELTLMIDKTIVQVESSGISDDELLKFLSQAAVDRLAKALAS